MTATFTGADASAEPLRVGIEDLPSLVGRTIGTSPAMPVTDQRINEFAEATEDRQWIHIDTERAANGPFGTTIAHGFLTLSLATAQLWQVLEVPDAGQIVNYGLNKVRFPAPVPSGAQITLTVRVAGVDPIPGGFQVTFETATTVIGGAKPSCVAEVVLRYLRGA